MTTTAKKPASEKSIAYLTDIVRQRDVDPGLTLEQSLIALTKWLAGGRTQAEISAMIDRNKAKPKRLVVVAPAAAGAPTVYTPYPSVPDAVVSSKYAIKTELLLEVPSSWRKQEYLFFEVKQVRGRRVVRRLLGSIGAFERTLLPAALAAELFGHLGKQEVAFEAAKTFGEIYQCCGRCGAELTDDTSRERQFGPICWSLMGHMRAA